jgi:hypothetical protein
MTMRHAKLRTRIVIGRELRDVENYLSSSDQYVRRTYLSAFCLKGENSVTLVGSERLVTG